MNFGRILVLICAACFVGARVHGALFPYTVDSATLHLWHLDESTLPCVDAAPGGTNLAYATGGATLGNASYLTNSPISVSFTNCINFGTLTASNAVIYPAGSGNVGTAIPFN